MSAAARWILYGLIGAGGGLVTYLASLPYFPVVTLRSLFGPMPEDPKGMIEYMARYAANPQTTLGTTYGNVAYFLLGATITAGIVTALRWERDGAGAGIFWGVLAFPLGGAFSRAMDALHDVMIHALGASAGLLPDVVWSGLVAMGIALTIGFLAGGTRALMRRALIAGAVGGIAAALMESALSPLRALAKDGSPERNPFGGLENLRALENQNIWESERWVWLGNYVTMGLALGLAWAFAEATFRRATLRLELGRNEGQSWELSGAPTMLGSAEGLAIRLPARLGIAPRHASLVPHPQHGVALAPEPGQTLALNGSPSAGDWLRHGDRIGLGRATLVYELPGGKRTVAPAVRTPEHWLESPDGRRAQMPEGVSVLGSAPGLAFALPYAGVLPHHAEIRVSGPRAILADLSGAGGNRELRDGDAIELGTARLVYRRMVRGLSGELR